MKIKEIENLLSRFYEGNTSKQEEQQLLNFFHNEVIPSHLIIDKKLFEGLQFEDIQKDDRCQIPKKLEKNIEHLIDDYSKEKQIIKSNKYLKYKKCLYGLGCLAASILLIFFISKYPSSTDSSEAEEAIISQNSTQSYEQVEKTLLLVANNIEKGIHQLEYTENELNRIRTVLTEQFK